MLFLRETLTGEATHTQYPNTFECIFGLFGRTFCGRKSVGAYGVFCVPGIAVRLS